MTGGGPAGASTVVVQQIYDLTFRYGRAGEASALSWMLFLLVLIVTISADPRPEEVGETDAFKRLGTIALTAVVVVGALLMFIPFLWTTRDLDLPRGRALSTPPLIRRTPRSRPIPELFANTPFARVVLNSLVLAVVTTLLQLLTSSMAAYVFSRMPFPGGTRFSRCTSRP